MQPNKSIFLILGTIAFKEIKTALTTHIFETLNCSAKTTATKPMSIKKI